MKRKLVCALVDNDPESHNTFSHIINDSSIAELRYKYYNAIDFLKAEANHPCDLCLLEIMLPDINGFILAERISKPYIYITKYRDKLLDALAMDGPIDVVPKPTQVARLNAALEKAYLRILGNTNFSKQYELFNIAEKNGKANIFLSDIHYVKTHSSDRRNKMVVLKNGTVLTFMDCTFKRLLDLSPKLCQVNKSELISVEILDLIEYDTIFLKQAENLIPIWVTFSFIYRDDFYSRLNSLKQQL